MELRIQEYPWKTTDARDLLEENKALREALEFYSHKYNYHDYGKGCTPDKVRMDYGDRARKALNVR